MVDERGVAEDEKNGDEAVEMERAKEKDRVKRRAQLYVPEPNRRSM